MKARISGKVIWLPRPDPDIEAELDAKHARLAPGVLQWHLEEAKEPSLLKKAVSYVQAVMSPPANDATFSQRLAVCRGCPHIQVTSQGEFCGACGCGQRAQAELGTKLRMSGAKCPRNKW